MSPSRISELPDHYRSALSDEDTKIVVATSSGRQAPVGMAVGSVSVRDDLVPSTWARLDDVWVEPSRRRDGVARRMWTELLGFFRSRGADSVILEYSVGNAEAESMWRSAGFSPILTSAVADIDELISKSKPGAE